MFQLTAKGDALDGSASVQIDRGIGTLRLGKAQMPLVLYYGLNFSGFDVGCGLGFAEDRLVTVWLYCKEEGLVHLWWADTAGGPLQDVLTTGSCQVSYIPRTTPLALAAVDLPVPVTDAGFSVMGPDIDLRDDLQDGTTGRLRWEKQWLPAWVFEVIDCHDCGGAGWAELHLLAYDAGQRRLLSIIAYLFANKPGEVKLGWGAWLPALTLPPPIDMPAQWTFTTR